MEQLRCTYCGGALRDRGDYYICESCRTKIKKSAMERLSDQDIFDLNAARRLKETFRFDEAETAYDEVLRCNPDCEEAAWGAFLAEYGIEYQVEEQKPTFHALSDIPGCKSRYYGALSSEHKAEVDRKIEPERLKIMRSVATLPVYDVFLSLKINDEDERRTPEHEWAMQLYYDLEKQGYRVFLSTQVLQTANFDWEPHIYRAIRTCRIMLVLTSSIDNTNAPWVRNEWRRILSRIRNTPAGEQPPAYRVIAKDMNCVPPALSGKQVLLHGDMHLLELIESAVKAACPSSEDTKSPTVGHIQVPQSIRNIKHIPLLKELLRDAGFTNIRDFPLHDMDGSDGYPWKEGSLASIMVAGADYNFDENAKYFDPATPVLITYHCLSEEAVAEQKNREEAARKEREEVDRRARAEAERKAREEAERKRKYEQEQAKKQPLFAYDTNGCVSLIDKNTIGRVCIPEDAKGIAYEGFEECEKITEVIIPDSVTRIGRWAFQGCTDLTSITIPNSVTEIGGFAFSGCTGLTSITIPNSVTEIGESAFQGCTSLTSITIPNSVTKIGDWAFSSCTGLTNITIPTGVHTMGGNPFARCPDLRVSLAPGNNHFRMMGNCLISKGGTLVTGFNNSAIPTDGSVTEIGGFAFSGCTGLTNITIPNSVTEIGGYAFSGCTGLTSITIPNSVTKIGEWAFKGCTGLTNITIPDSVIEIGEYAFDGCTGLTNITIPDSVIEIGSLVFNHCSNLTSIRYTGTKWRWRRMRMRNRIWNGGSGITTIHCTNGDIKL